MLLPFPSPSVLFSFPSVLLLTMAEQMHHELHSATENKRVTLPYRFCLKKKKTSKKQESRVYLSVKSHFDVLSRLLLVCTEVN